MHAMRAEYDPEADAAYLHFTDAGLAPGRDTLPVATPRGVQAVLNLDWKNGKIVGLEILGAAASLHPDLLALATLPGEGQR
jgi:uncharacterized protein YuzE